jgi:probable H4MPT-linked C1 transfer pathway protein
MKWLALDIGGAHLKGADGQGAAISQPFPLWEKKEQLASALRSLIAQFPKVDHIAATMTGELCDCFESKADGVKYIVDSLSKAADRRHTRVYLTNGTLVAPTVAVRRPLLAAASNWHALARFAGRFAAKGTGLLIDVGSTTTDIIPLIDGQPVSMGRTDPQRLAAGELVYTGVQRSPICGLCGVLPWRGRKCPVAQEFFASTWDAYLIRGDMPEEPESTHTADHRSATKDRAHDRLARQICADRTLYTMTDAKAGAELIASRQLHKVLRAAHRVLTRLPERVQTVVISGRGEFLARWVVEKMTAEPQIVSLTEQLGEQLSRSAAAHALAVLATEGAKS